MEELLGKRKDAWHQYRFAQRLCFVTFLLCPGIIGLIYFRCRFDLPGAALEPYVAVLGLPAMVVCFISWMVCQYWKCPQCGKRFFMTWYISNSFGRKCLHCGLPKWADPEDDGEGRAVTKEG